MYTSSSDHKDFYFFKQKDLCTFMRSSLNSDINTNINSYKLRLTFLIYAFYTP